VPDSPIFAAALQVSTVAWSHASSLADPAGSSSLLAAVQWLEGTLLGTIATTVAVIAVASVGFMALSGRVDLRRAAAVILGCFILFGASSIVAGLEGLARGADASGPSQPVISADISPLAQPPAPQPGYDPYAGAAVPMR
jgi:type IV secretion system protein VirB2